MDREGNQLKQSLNREEIHILNFGTSTIFFSEFIGEDIGMSKSKMLDGKDCIASALNKLLDASYLRLCVAISALGHE